MSRKLWGRRWSSASLIVALGSGAIACSGAEAGGPEEAELAPDVLKDVRCEPWSPGDADWSSLPAARPALLGALSAAPSGRYVYAVGSWWEGGKVVGRALRSNDLGDSWCVLSTPETLTEVTATTDDERLLYALSEAGSLLRSEDGGDSWQSVNDAVPAKAQFRWASSQQLIVTTVEEPRLVLSSTDGGESFAELRPPQLIADGEQTLLASIAAVAIDPATAGRVLVAGSWSRLEGGDLITRVGWFTSSADGSDAWQEVAPPALASEDHTAPLAVTADSAGALFAVAGGRAARSVDWGESWTELPELPVREAVLSTLSSKRAGELFVWNFLPARPEEPAAWRSADGGLTWSPSELAAALAIGENGPLLGVTADGLAHSVDRDASWQASAPVAMPYTIKQSPLAPTKLWSVGTLDWYPARAPAALATRDLQSINGGLTWTAAGLAPDSSLLFDGADPKSALAGFDAWTPKRTQDGGQSWTALSKLGAIAAAATCAPPASCQYALHQTNSDTSLPCYLSKTEDLGRTWSDAVNVPAELCHGTPNLAVAVDDAQHVLAACGPAVCVSYDGGQSFESHPVGNDPKRYVGNILPLSGGVILATTWAIAQPAAEGHAVVARSDDGGETWHEVLDVGGGTLRSSIDHPDTVFLFEPRSNEPAVLHRSDDAGLSWRRISPPTPVGREYTLDFFDVADAGDGSFLATTTLGLARFR